MRPESDEHLVRYLLGELPESETEQLDERSITDDAFALRLRELENELIDRYARGEPSDAALERFGRACRTSPHLQERVRFAQALHARSAPAEPRASRGRTWVPSSAVWWSLASAAVLLLAVVGLLWVEHQRLRDALGQETARRASVEQQNVKLQEELARSRVPSTQPTAAVATFLLRPARRGGGDEITSVTIPSGSERVVLQLPIETDEQLTFWAAVKDLTANRIVWRSADLQRASTGGERIVALTIPASALNPQRYSVELNGIDRAGVSEVVTNYVVRIVVE